MKRILCVLLLCSPLFAQKVQLAWVAPPAPACGPVTGYNIYRAATAGGEVIGNKTASTTGAITYDDAAVAYGKTYFYKVTATANCLAAGSQESKFSNEVSATVPAQIIILQPPSMQPAKVIIP